MTRRPAAHGFSLIEVLVVFAIVSVLLGLAAPSLIHLRRNSQLSQSTAELLHGLTLARSEALRTGYNTFVQPLDGSDWNAGWHSFIDFDRNNAYTEGTDQRLFVAPSSPHFIHIYSLRSGNHSAVSFSANGFARAIAQQGSPNLTLVLERTDDTAAQLLHSSRQIIVARSGRVRSCNPSTDTTCTRQAVN